jgi:cysteinyl-tRNA synthetase
MSQELQTESTAPDLTELKKLFGPPPVLSTESEETYYSIMAAFVKCFAPGDFMVQMFMKDLTDSTWDAMRYTRHKTLAMERQYRQRLEYQAKRVKEAAERKRLAAPVKNDDEDCTPVEKRSFELLEVFESTVDDVKKILERTPTELDHARALEDVIEYHERLDALLGEAIERRNDALEQIGLYRQVLGHQLRGVSDDIIDAEFSEAKPEEMPLVPSSVQNQ